MITNSVRLFAPFASFPHISLNASRITSWIPSTGLSQLPEWNGFGKVVTTTVAAVSLITLKTEASNFRHSSEQGANRGYIDLVQTIATVGNAILNFVVAHRFVFGLSLNIDAVVLLSATFSGLYLVKVAQSTLYLVQSIFAASMIKRISSSDALHTYLCQKPLLLKSTLEKSDQASDNARAVISGDFDRMRTIAAEAALQEGRAHLLDAGSGLCFGAAQIAQFVLPVISTPLSLIGASLRLTDLYLQTPDR